MISGETPAIEVSGTFVLRGGGGVESKECGRYSVAVDSFRLADCCIWQRRHIEAVLNPCNPVTVLLAVATDLERVDGNDVKGSAARCSDMMRASMCLDISSVDTPDCRCEEI